MFWDILVLEIENQPNFEEFLWIFAQVIIKKKNYMITHAAERYQEK